METVACIDEISQKEDNLLKQIHIFSNSIRNIFIGLIVYFGIRYIYRNLKQVFESSDYNDFIANAKVKDRRSLLNKLEQLLEKSEQIKERLLRIIQIYPQPLLKTSLKNTKILNDYLEEKIEDYKLALNNNFINSMKKIVDGVNNNNLDLNKVKRGGSFLRSSAS